MRQGNHRPVNDRNHLDHFQRQRHTLAADALEVHCKADTRRLVARKRVPGREPVPHWGSGLGEGADLAVAAGVGEQARDYTMGIAVAVMVAALH